MKRYIILLTGALTASAALADFKPLQLSLTPDLALHGRTQQIEGLCLSLWGENPQTGLALGLVNGSSGESAGVSLALLLNYADDYTGVQLAAVNYTKGDFAGWQAGMVNYTGGEMKGLQTGGVNYAGNLSGVQIGVVNYAERAQTSVQIGLVNLCPQNEWFTNLPDELAPGMVFVNWRF